VVLLAARGTVRRSTCHPAVVDRDGDCIGVERRVARVALDLVVRHGRTALCAVRPVFRRPTSLHGSRPARCAPPHAARCARPLPPTADVRTGVHGLRSPARCGDVAAGSPRRRRAPSLRRSRRHRSTSSSPAATRTARHGCGCRHRRTSEQAGQERILGGAARRICSISDASCRFIAGTAGRQRRRSTSQPCPAVVPGCEPSRRGPRRCVSCLAVLSR